MLVLTRKLDEAIMIGDDIEIRVVQIRGTGDSAHVRIGVSAPRGIPVLRKEIYGQVSEENLRALRQGAGNARQMATLLGRIKKREESTPGSSQETESGQPSET